MRKRKARQVVLHRGDWWEECWHFKTGEPCPFELQTFIEVLPRKKARKGKR